MDESLIAYNAIELDYNTLFISYDGFVILGNQVFDYSNNTFTTSSIENLTASGESSLLVDSGSTGETSFNFSEPLEGLISVSLN